MRKKIYILSLFTIMLNGFRSLAQNYYAKTIEKIGITSAISSSSKMAIAKNTIFVCGEKTNTVDLDPGSATYTVTGSTYIRRVTTSQQLLWAVGLGNLAINRLIIDNQKSVYVVGNFNTTIDADPGPGVANLLNAGSASTYDAFVIKLDSNGIYQWSQRLGSTGNDYANDIAFDPATNSVFITGYFNGTVDFDPASATAYNLTANGADMYVWRLNATTGTYFTSWANSGASDQYGNTIVCDANSNVIVSGQYFGTPDMDPGVATYTLATASGGDGFVAKYNQVGTFLWAKYFGGPVYSTNAFRSLLIPGGNLIVGGNFTDVNFLYNGTATMTNNSALGTTNDIFYLSISPATGTLTNGYVLGGSNEDQLSDLSLDQANNLIISGASFGVTNTNPVGTNTVSFSNSYNGTFFTKMSGTNVFDYTRTFGGGLSSARISNLLVNDYNEYIISGYFSWTGNLDPSPGLIQNYYAGNSNSNGFLINYAPCTSTVVAAPVITNTLTATCNGLFYTLNASVGSTLSGINWYTSPTSTTAIATGPSYNNCAPCSTVGVYPYYVTALNGCGTSSATVVNFTVSDTPNLTATSSHSTVCSGQTATLTASGATNYTWSNSTTTATTIVTPGVTTSYTVTGNNPGCADASIVITQSVSSSTALTASSSNTVLCAGQTATLTASGATTYTWSNSATTATTIITPTVTTSYTVTGSNPGCTGVSVVITQSVSACTTGINEPAIDNRIRLYPNPASNLITLTTGDIVIRNIVLLNALGEVVQSENTKHNELLLLNIEHLSAGIYFINIETKEGNVIKKIIKQ